MKFYHQEIHGLEDASYVRVPLHARDGSVRAYALIDRDDAHLAEHRWYLGNRGYVLRSTPRINGVQGKLKLHRAVLRLSHDSPRVDHINRDKLDNRRANLRLVTEAQNAQNVPATKGSTSRFRGVHWNKPTRNWEARVVIGGRVCYLGRFEDERDAAAAASIFRVLFMPYSYEASIE